MYQIDYLINWVSTTRYVTNFIQPEICLKKLYTVLAAQGLNIDFMLNVLNNCSKYLYFDRLYPSVLN